LSPDELLEGLTEPQSEAVTHAHGPLLVLAGPGSGKTRVITHRAAFLAQTVTRPWNILAITFTNKAAGEMAERMLRLTGDSGVTCNTFHAFCARLLRIHGDRVGLLPNYSIFDMSDQTAAMKDAVERCGLSADNFTPGGLLSTISRAKNDMRTPHELAESGGWREKSVARVGKAVSDTAKASCSRGFCCNWPDPSMVVDR
jgi:DNA helicase-2/ATP-dependent DNA helicase PcrA